MLAKRLRRRLERGLSRRIFVLLCDNPYGLTSQELIDRIYPYGVGGPNPVLTIRTTICDMNLRWQHTGSLFRIHSRRNLFRYRIYITRSKER